MLVDNALTTATRRKIMRGIAFALSGTMFKPNLNGQRAGQEMQASPVADDHRTALHQEIDLRATPAQVKGVLLDAKQFSGFTRFTATIDPTEGGAFSLFGGLIVGRNLEIVAETRVVQAWRPAHWEPGLYSVVWFTLKEHNAATRVILDHTGFPEGNYDHLFSGWQAHYWEPLKALFG